MKRSGAGGGGAVFSKTCVVVAFQQCLRHDLRSRSRHLRAVDADCATDFMAARTIAKIASGHAQKRNSPWRGSGHRASRR